MPNRLADTAAAAINRAMSKQTQAMTQLPVLKRFVAALKAGNASGLARETPAVFALSPGGIISVELGALPGNFWEKLILAIGVAEQGPLFLEFVKWFSKERGFNPGPVSKSTALSSMWEALEGEIERSRATAAVAPVDAADALDQMMRLARTTGSLLAGGNAAGGDKQAEVAMASMHIAILHTLLLNIQPLVDAGIEELANGKDPTILRALSGQIDDLRKLFAFPVPTHLRFPIVKDAKKFLILDSFPPARGRSFGVTTFDLFSPDPPPEKLVPYAGALLRRMAQLKQAVAVYGRHLDAAIESSDVALKLRRGAVSKVSKPTSLLDHDGLIRLLVLVFLEAYEPKKAQPVEAVTAGWQGVTEFLEDHLDTFTAHPGQNLADEGPDYLKTQFPRTVAGELLHDCAVYAVLAGYWLLALAQELKARHRIDLGLAARLALLPNHMSLLITLDPAALKSVGSAPKAPGAMFLNNAHLSRFTKKELEEKFAQWQTDRPSEDVDPTDPQALKAKFIEDFAAHTFMRAANMPITSRPLPGAKAKVTPAAVWKAYRDYDASRTDGVLFGKAVATRTGELSQFNLRYLKIAMDRARFINETIIGEFWRVRAPQVFYEIVGPRDWDDPKRSQTVLRYAIFIEHLIDLYTKKANEFVAEETKVLAELNTIYQKNRDKLVAKHARTAFSTRLGGNFGALLAVGAYLTVVREHAKVCRSYVADRGKGKVVPAPPLPPFLGYEPNEQPL